MIQASFIGIIKELGYGVPFDYQYGNSYKMNQFLLYLIENKVEIAQKLSDKFSPEVSDTFIQSVDGLDQFEVYRFLNLELFDCSEKNFSELVLNAYMAGIGLLHNSSELFFSYPFEVDIYLDGELIPLDRIEEYNGKIVSISFDEDFPLLFETTAQREHNLAYFKHLLEPILEGLGLSMRSNLKEIEVRFGISN